MAYTAASIANAFLSRSFRDKCPISPMKIQKLIYIFHGFSLVEFDEPVLDEVFEAWKFGPVLSSLYQEVKHVGSGSIENYLRDIDPETGASSPAPIPDDQALNEIIDFVWGNNKDRSAMDLSNWTHRKGAPWDQVTVGGAKIIRHKEVPNDLIKK